MTIRANTWTCLLAAILAVPGAPILVADCHRFAVASKPNLGDR
jgi:hypothetical protein